MNEEKINNEFKKDFPIFKNNPGLIFIDNAASTQKPSYVIDGIKHFLENDYANIHRGAYSLSEKSENLYEKSKVKVKEFINARFPSEINYTYNSTYALNLLVLSLRRTKLLRAGDKVLLSIKEHHANIVPWIILKEEIGIEIEYIDLDSDFGIDYEDLESKLTPNTKVVSLTYVSNVTGKIFDCEKIGDIIKSKDPNILYIIDGSQAVPNFKVDVVKLKCDFMFFTGHKVMADTGIGILYGRKELLKSIEPGIGGGGSINWVKKQEYSPSGLPFRFEPGTPNIVGAVSLLKAFEYIESIGGYEAIKKNERLLIDYALGRLSEFGDKIMLIGSHEPDNRIGIFTFFIPGVHLGDLAEHMASKNICVRAGHHCTQPFMDYCEIDSCIRISLYIYNDTSDIDQFFDALREYIKVH